MSRLSFITLICFTVVSATAYAQTPPASPFGAASAPLSAQEVQAIKREGEAQRRARAAAALKAKQARQAAQAIKEEPKAPEAAKPEIQAAPAAAPVAAPVKDSATAPVDTFSMPVPDLTEEAAPSALPAATPEAQGSDLVPSELPPVVPDVKSEKPEMIIQPMPDVKH